MAVARFLLGTRWRVGRGRMTSLNGRNSLQARRRLARVGALAKHMDYLGRGSAAEDRARGVVFNAEEDLTREELAALRREMIGDRHHFRFIVSPEAGDRLNLKDFAREFVKEMEADVSTPLTWIGATHGSVGNAIYGRYPARQT
jgi:type IV secretory pathway VirD2 relaxase